MSFSYEELWGGLERARSGILSGTEEMPRRTARTEPAMPLPFELLPLIVRPDSTLAIRAASPNPFPDRKKDPALHFVGALIGPNLSNIALEYFYPYSGTQSNRSVMAINFSYKTVTELDPSNMNPIATHSQGGQVVKALVHLGQLSREYPYADSFTRVCSWLGDEHSFVVPGLNMIRAAEAS